MLSAFLFFIAGALTMRLLQFMLSVSPMLDIYKHAELTALQILLEIDVQSRTELKISKLVYEDLNKEEEYKEVEKALKQKYNSLITNSINRLKKCLPYKVTYNSLEEAVQYYMSTGANNGKKG